MKKVMTLVLAVFVASMAVPAFADSGTGESEAMKNIRSGAHSTATAWTEVLDSTHAEASKGRGAGEQVTGVAMGGVVGARKTLHRMGAGAIDLLTFWIPKKKPLISE